MHLDSSCCRDKVSRAAGLRSAVMVFASLLRQFYRDGTTSYRLPGFSHLDNFTVTRNLHPSTGTLQKPCQRLTQTATPHTCWAVRVNSMAPCTLDNFKNPNRKIFNKRDNLHPSSGINNLDKFTMTR